jgi:hypothetical protein
MILPSTNLKVLVVIIPDVQQLTHASAVMFTDALVQFSVVGEKEG